MRFAQDETPEQITAKLHHAVSNLLEKN